MRSTIPKTVVGCCTNILSTTLSLAEWSHCCSQSTVQWLVQTHSGANSKRRGPRTDNVRSIMNTLEICFWRSTANWTNVYPTCSQLAFIMLAWPLVLFHRDPGHCVARRELCVSNFVESVLHRLLTTLDPSWSASCLAGLLSAEMTSRFSHTDAHTHSHCISTRFQGTIRVRNDESTRANLLSECADALLSEFEPSPTLRGSVSDYLRMTSSTCLTATHHTTHSLGVRGSAGVCQDLKQDSSKKNDLRRANDVFALALELQKKKSKKEVVGKAMCWKYVYQPCFDHT